MSIIGTLSGTLGAMATGGPIGGVLSGVAGSAAGAVLQGISSWILNGTRGALEAVANLIGSATAPNLHSTWFSSTYWRVAALAAMLTLPFLAAAAVQAVARADLGLLARAAFGYLPVSLLAVSLAAPLTMLALAATDQMSAAVSTSAATGGAGFLLHAAAAAAVLSTATGGSPFFAVIVGLLALMAALALAIELLIRAAAVYVVVLMLPLAFAALVWPARRVWAARMVELLASLILSKFVIVAVLSLAAAAFSHGTPGIGELLVAMSLLLLSTASPWVLLRILPFTELASGAAGVLRGELPVDRARSLARDAAVGTTETAMELPSRLLDQSRSMGAGDGSDPDRIGAAGGTVSAEPGSSESAEAPWPASAATDAAAWPPPGATSAESGGAGATAAPQTGSTEPSAPFVLPAAWRSEEPVRLDETLLGAASVLAEPPPDPSPAETPASAHDASGPDPSGSGSSGPAAAAGPPADDELPEDRG